MRSGQVDNYGGIMSREYRWQRFWSVVFLAGFLVLAPGRGNALQMVHPADGTYLYRSGHLIIKGGDAPALDGVSIEINGVKSDVIDIASNDYRKMFRDFVILEADFDPGENRVTIEGYAGGKRVAEVRATIFLADEKRAAPAAKFRAGNFHLPEREALCQGCHNMTPSAKELEGATRDTSPCGSCHARIIDRKHVHGPAGVFQCSFCHKPESRPLKYMVPGGEGRICLECHADKLAEFKKSKFVHGPVEAEICVACHDPHASDQPAQLQDETNRLCTSCHASVRVGEHVVRGVSGSGHPLSGPKNPADPSRPFHCASCHDPHKGQTESMFAFNLDNRFALCQKCHKK